MLDLFKKEKINYLLEKESNEVIYMLKVNSDLNLGEENKRTTFDITSKIRVSNIVENSEWKTRIELLFICGNSALPYMKGYLQDALILTNISPTIVIERSAIGQIKQVDNSRQLRRDWQNWKVNNLPYYIKDSTKQNRFIQNYERGLKNIDQIKNNFTYLLLIPPFYEIPHFPNGSWKIPKVAIWNSRFIDDLNANYDYIVKQDNNNDGIASLIYQANNLRDVKNLLSVRNFYRKFLPNHNSENYKVDISGAYKIEKDTGKIIEGSLYHTESLNDNFVYNLSHELKIIEPST